MTRTLRLAALAASAAAFTAVPASAATPTTQATASASIRKPLIISRVADLSFGNILLSGSGTYSANVVLAQNGTVTCPATYFTCSGTTSPAIYNVSGNKSQQVNITADTSLTLTGPNGTLSMAVSAPANVVLTNSGFPGTDFGIGGTLTLTNNTPDGVYSGTFTVTAEYN
jgi:hypothetical protein